MNNEYPINLDASDAENEQVLQSTDEQEPVQASVPEQTDAAQDASADADNTTAQTADAPANEEPVTPTDNPYAQGQQFRRETPYDTASAPRHFTNGQNAYQNFNPYTGQPYAQPIQPKQKKKKGSFFKKAASAVALALMARSKG